MSSKAFSTPPKPASASAMIGCSQSVLSFLPRRDLVRAQQRVVDAAHDRRHRIRRIQGLVRVHLTREVGIARDLPAGEVDRLESGTHLLHRLVAGQCTQRIHER
jgi:hypothetical protein